MARKGEKDMLAMEQITMRQMTAHRVTSRQLAMQLNDLGLQSGDLLMVHSSYRSLGVGHPEVIVQALLQALSRDGTLMMPALTYLQQPSHLHDTRITPSCVGYLSEYFRTREGTLRSLHPTHSVCAVGPLAEEALEFHILDKTPCGSNSPFNYLLHQNGKILMLGCGLTPNTSMHAIEEYVRPTYLLSQPKVYTIIDTAGDTFRKAYYPHRFQGVTQRYDRVAALLDYPAMRTGKVGQAVCHLIEAGALLEAVLGKLQEDPFYFVEPVETPHD
jgi:aminoglycoside 3-N-acetyltransferase